MNAKPHHFLQTNLNRSKRPKETPQIYRMNLSKFGQEENCFNKFFKRTVLVHYLHANERPIPLSPNIIALGNEASRVSCFVNFLAFLPKNVQIF